MDSGVALFGLDGVMICTLFVWVACGLWFVVSCLIYAFEACS